MAEQPITAHFALKRLYSELNGHATEITYSAGRGTEFRRKINNSV